VVQKLADRYPFHERRGLVVEPECAFVRKLQNDRRDEGLRHARDAEAVIDREALAGAEVGDSCRSLEVPVRTARDRGGARNPRRDDLVQLRLEPHGGDDKAMR